MYYHVYYVHYQQYIYICSIICPRIIYRAQFSAHHIIYNEKIDKIEHVQS